MSNPSRAPRCRSRANEDVPRSAHHRRAGRHGRRPVARSALRGPALHQVRFRMVLRGRDPASARARHSGRSSRRPGACDPPGRAVHERGRCQSGQRLGPDEQGNRRGDSKDRAGMNGSDAAVTGDSKLKGRRTMDILIRGCEAPVPAKRIRRPLHLLAGGALATISLLTVLAGLARPAAAQESVKIGEIEAQTGSLTTYGWMSAQGMRMAVEQINKAGGFEVAGKKYKLDLLNPDSQGNPQQALIELKKMLDQEHVKYVFGPFLTNVYKGIEPYANGSNGKFLLMGGATAIHFDL